MSEPTRKRLRGTRFLFRAPLWGELLLLYVATQQAQSIKLENAWQFLPDQEGTLKLSDLGKSLGCGRGRFSSLAQFGHDRVKHSGRIGKGEGASRTRLGLWRLCANAWTEPTLAIQQSGRSIAR